MVAVGSNLLVMGGKYTPSIEVLKSPDGNWEYLRSFDKLKYGSKHFCAIALTDHEFVVMGGTDNNDHINKKVAKYDMATPSISDLADMPEAKFSHACARSGNLIYVTGGTNRHYTELDQGWKFLSCSHVKS